MPQFRCGVSSQRQNALADRFSTPASPIASNTGTPGFLSRHAIWAATATAAPRISSPLRKATLALVCRDEPTTARLTAYVRASPRLSSPPDSSEEERLNQAAPIIMTKVARLMASTIFKVRRCEACIDATSTIFPQSPQSDITNSVSQYQDFNRDQLDRIHRLRPLADPVHWRPVHRVRQSSSQ